MNAIPSEYLAEALASYRKYREMGAKAMAQLDERQLFVAPDPESNSIAIIVKHLRGNMRSRWTDFLTTDGEKPDRERDSEFEMEEATTREEVMRWWDEAWGSAEQALESLRPTDLSRVVTIRGEPHSVLQAIQRNLLHASYHVGQIVYLAKYLRGSGWETLSIPRKR